MKKILFCKKKFSKKFKSITIHTGYYQLYMSNEYMTIHEKG